MQPAINSARRRLFQDGSNLAAAPVSGSPSIEAVAVPSTGSGTFSAVPNSNGGQSSALSPKDPSSAPPSDSPPAISDPNSLSETKTEENENSHEVAEIIVLVLPGAAIFLILIAGILMLLRQKGPKTVAPSKTGLSGPLQKAFVEGKFFLFMTLLFEFIFSNMHLRLSHAIQINAFIRTGK